MQIEPYRWRLSPSFFTHLWKAVTQQHHRELLPAFARCIPRDGVVLDIGAHAGQFAKLFASIAIDGRIYAIEPGSYARAILRAAIGARRFRNIAVLPVALGDEARLETLKIPLKASGAVGFGLSHFGEAETRWPRVATETVAQTTVDALVAALALDRLDFIKADIEGGELRMLHGARATLDHFRPRLLIELTEAHLARAGDTLVTAFGFLAERGYRAFALDAAGGFTAVASPRDGDFWFL
ncbi:MAG TPA: FkbM family methyltransferase, partial [Stellaceae bacterium]|nr:FkbM family methyltransferase [Stellaceae bacterium]